MSRTLSFVLLIVDVKLDTSVEDIVENGSEKSDDRPSEQNGDDSKQNSNNNCGNDENVVPQKMKVFGEKDMNIKCENNNSIKRTLVADKNMKCSENIA